MNLIKYFKGERNFILMNDLVEVLDEGKYNQVDWKKFENKNKEALIIAKYPIFKLGVFQENVFKLKEVSYSSKYDLFIVDNENKVIILDEDNVAMKIRYINHDIFSSINKTDWFKCNLNEYKVYLHDNLIKQMDCFLERESAGLIKKHYEYLYTNGENFCRENYHQEDVKLSKLISSLVNELKIEYIFEDEVIKPKYEYISALQVSKLYKNYSSTGYSDELLLLYVNDRKELSKLVEFEFNRAIAEKDNYSVQSINNRFFRNELKGKLRVEKIEEFKMDNQLKIYKEIIKSLKNGGKTVTINDKKYDNRADRSNINELRIGSYKTGYVKFDEVEVIKFGRKELFNIKNFK